MPVDVSIVIGWAEQTSDLAVGAERLDAYAVCTGTRAAVLSLGGAGAAPTAAEPLRTSARGLIQLERHCPARTGPSGQVHLAVDGLDSRTARDALAIGRLIDVGDQAGRTYQPVFTDTGWDEPRYLDRMLDHPGDRAGAIEQVLDRLTATLAELPEGGRVSIGSAALLEEHTTHAFATSAGLLRSFSRSRIELRVFVDLTVRGARHRVVASAFENRVDRLNVRDLLREATMQVLATAAPTGGPGRPEVVLLSPAVSARLLTVLTRHLTRHLDGAQLGPVRYGLVDAGRAPGAPSAALFDHEGSLTGTVDLVSASGAVAALNSRGTVNRREPDQVVRLGGHATWQAFQTAPEPWPRNVRLRSDRDDVDLSDRQYLAFQVRDDDASRMPGGDRFTLRLATALLSDGVPVARTDDVVIQATPGQLLRAVRWVSPVTGFRAGPEFSVGGCWLELDTSRLVADSSNPSDHRPPNPAASPES